MKAFKKIKLFIVMSLIVIATTSTVTYAATSNTTPTNENSTKIGIFVADPPGW